MNDMKKFIAQVLMLMFSVFGFSQTIVPSGSPNQITDFKGGVKAGKALTLPATDVEHFPTEDKFGQVRISPTDSIVRYHNGTNWVKVIDEKNDYVTHEVLIDSLEKQKQFVNANNNIFVPYKGAKDNVDLGSYRFNSSTLYAGDTINSISPLDRYLLVTYKDSLTTTSDVGLFVARSSYNQALYVSNDGGGGLPQNTIFGRSALISNISGIRNTVFGFVGLRNSMGSSKNTGMGYQVFASVTGNIEGNTGIGNSVLQNIQSGSNYNTWVGATNLNNLNINPLKSSYNTILGANITLTALELTTPNQVILADGEGNRAFEKKEGVINLRGNSINVPSNASGGFNVFHTSDQTINYEKGMVRFNGNVFEVGCDFGGTGVTREARFGTAGTNTSGMNRFLSVKGNTPFFSYQFGGTGLAGYVMDICGGQQLQASNNTQGALSITPTVSQSGTASFKGLYESVYLQTTGSGTKLLFDFGTNSAANNGGVHTSKINADTEGNMSVAGQIMVNTIPSAPNHVIRKAELDAKVNLAASVTLNSSTTLTLSQFGTNGQLDVYVNATTAPITITLPAAAAMAGYQVNVIKTDTTSNIVTIQGASGININQSATYALPAVSAKVTIKSNTAQYWAF